ncbi:MAG: hypothetical protein KC731_16755 [Myxococcales bacterium]|nr:hypothetical protein [Myxococcales bacterium]
MSIGIVGVVLTWSTHGMAMERMRPDTPIQCIQDHEGKLLYVQCDPATNTCLFHDGCAPRAEGAPESAVCKPLERLVPCTEDASVLWEDLVARGTKLVPAIAPTPPGWMRDERGRVFQTHFDMNRRLWLGGRWEPSFSSRGGGLLGRAVIETGFRADVLSEDTRKRYRFRALTGEVTLNPLGVRATAFRFDSSSEADTPFLRFTTFWPEPARHDSFLNVGGWVEVMTIDYRPRQTDRELHMRFVAGGPTLDLWHSLTMASFVRLRMGAAFDDLRQNGEAGHDHLAATPLGAIEADLTLDRKGMHRLVIGTEYEVPLVWRNGTAEPPTLTHRFLNSFSYEPILLAINDQPLSLVLSTTGGYRSDLPDQHRGWEIRGGLGLRINFWVPALDANDGERVRRERGE